MSEEMVFFIFLVEQYAAYKGTSANRVLKKWESLDLTQFFYDMYEMYHTESLKNAFDDIDRQTSNRQSTKNGVHFGG